jgi:hypothetical protein
MGLPMITAAWLIFKSFIGKVIDLFTRYPLQFILVLVCCYAFWQKTRYEAIAYDFEAYKTSVQLQADMQKVKNEILRKQAETALNDATVIYDNNLKAIKNEYLKMQKLDSVTIGDLRGRLRDQLAADTFAMPETPADTETSSEKWRDSYSTLARQYETLKYGCAITTNDYNLLRDWSDAACEQVGCE